MTAQEAVKRNEKAQGLKVWKVDDTWFYVESEEGKIAYKCCISDHGDYCSCGDFTTRVKNDPHFKCKHLLAVMNSIPGNTAMEAQILEKRKPKLDERFVKQVEGRDFALYAGLLDLAHQKNLINLEVDLLQFPTPENAQTAICKATGKTAGGSVFIDIGDANPQNCNSKVSRHIIRMASTRAKARCLRDMTNIGMTCLEELGDDNGVNDETGAADRKKDNVKKFNPKQAGHGKAEGATKPETEVPAQTGSSETSQGNDAGSQPANIPATETRAEAADPKPPVRGTRASGKSSVKPGNGNGEDKIPIMSEAQKSAIYNLARRRGISVEELENMAMKSFNMPVENLTHENAMTFIRTLQQAA